MKLPPWLASALLALALLVGQVGGAAHALSHLGDGHDKDRPHGACALCVAYGELDQAAVPAPPALGAQVPAIRPPLPIGQTHSPRRIPAYASRAPPLHLV